MKQNTNQNWIGIDIGTNYLRACIRNDEVLDFIKVPSEGVQAGNIVNQEEFTISLTKLVNKIKKNYNIKKLKLTIGVSGTTLYSSSISISTSVNNKDSKVTEKEIDNIVDRNEQTYNAHNLSTLYHLIRKYRLNGGEIKSSPLGMRGSRLEARVFSVYYDSLQIKMISDICKNLNLEIVDILASPLIEADLILDNKQKLSGVGLINIGYAHSSLVVFENYKPLLVNSLEFGTQNLDKELALGLKVSLEEAHDIRHGGKLTGFNKKKYEDIIEKTLTSWTASINNELDIVKRKELLPSGLIILGEISHMLRFETIFKNKMRLPIKLDNYIIDNLKDYNISNTEWLRPLGLAIIDNKDKAEYRKAINKFYDHIRDILCQFLP